MLKKTDGYNLERFLHDDLLQHGISMALINIGESVKKLSEDFKHEHQEIEWRGIVDLRNLAVHNYDGLHLDRIWGNVTKDIPELLEQVEKILLAEGVEKGE